MMEIELLIESYFPGLDDGFYASANEQLETWSTFVDLLCALALEDKGGSENRVDLRHGSGFDDSETVDLVRSIAEKGIPDVLYSPQLFELFYNLYQKGYSNYGKPLYPLSAIVADGLSPIEIFAVILTAVVSGNRKYENVLKALNEDANESRELTVGLCLDLASYCLIGAQFNSKELYDENSFLNKCVFKTSDSELTKRYGAARQLAFRESVSAYIASGSIPGQDDDPEELIYDGDTVRRFSSVPLHSCISPVASDMTDSGTICLIDTYEEIEKALGYGGAIELDGAEGSGRQYLLSRAAEEHDMTVVKVDMRLFREASNDEKTECIRDLIFMGRVRRMIPYLWCTGDQTDYEESIRDLFSVLTAALPTVCIGSVKPVADDVLGGVSDSIYRISIPETSAKDQITLWKEAALKYGVSFPKGYDHDVLVSKYIMSPGRIYETMRNVAAAMSGAKSYTIEEDILEDQIRRSCSVQFGESATRLSSPFTWEDLMISPESEKLLRMAANRVKYRTTVNEGFGFAKKLPYGRGVAIVFYGPPGTGKTMAAQVLANDLGLDIYRIDLSQVSSKYIGETEKNLGAVFEAAKNSNAILFFDEADSLFSKRTEVSSSIDKYANAETSYLLQKIEEYSGVSVLATNNMQSFDAAFKRRMSFIIPIEAPDEGTRLRLWEAVFPEDAPLDKTVDTRILAHVAELTGSSIKSAAVSAAYMAAADGRNIGWEDLITAIELEGIKTGTLGLGNKLREAMLAGID